jgi:hypothetical protein
LALLTDGRVLVAEDYEGNRIRVLSANLQQVSTVAGGGAYGHRDGAAAQAQFNCPAGLALLPDGRVLAVDEDNLARPRQRQRQRQHRSKVHPHASTRAHL